MMKKTSMLRTYRRTWQRVVERERERDRTFAHNTVPGPSDEVPARPFRDLRIGLRHKAARQIASANLKKRLVPLWYFS